MPLACGCEVKAGLPVSTETIKAHFQHTIEALIFWEMIIRRELVGSPFLQDKVKLAEARITLIDAIEELYPEVKQ